MNYEVIYYILLKILIGPSSSYHLLYSCIEDSFMDPFHFYAEKNIDCCHYHHSHFVHTNPSLHPQFSLSLS